VAAARWPADVVYVHHPHPLADLAALLGPRRPTVILHHSDVQRQRVARLAYGPLAAAVSRRAAAVVVATASHLAHARDLGPAGRAKARVIPFGVDLTRFAPPSRTQRPPGFPPPERGPVGVFVGRLVSYKGLDVLVRAVRGTGLNLVIVGGGPLRHAVMQWIADAGVGDRVALAGEVGDAALPGYYQTADYVVLPSTTAAEMFGVTLLEAMACGRPLVSTALPTGVSEVNVAGVTGLQVPPGDAEALRQAMLRLAGDADLRTTLGAAGRQRVEEHFGLDRMVEAHLNLCSELCGAGAR
jgi:rhamnosyl/mannosyltransferase